MEINKETKLVAKYRITVKPKNYDFLKNKYGLNQVGNIFIQFSFIIYFLPELWDTLGVHLK